MYQRVSFISKNSDLHDGLLVVSLCVCVVFTVWHKLKAVKAKERWLPDQEVKFKSALCPLIDNKAMCH